MVKSLKKIGNHLLWVIVAIACGCILLGQLGRVSLAIDSVNLLLPFWVAGGLAGLIGLLAQPSIRRRARVPLGLAAAVLLSAMVAIELPAPASNGAMRDGQELKIITFNLWKKNVSPQTAADWIRGERPDIVVLLEAKERTSRVPAMLEDMYPYRLSCHRRYFCSTIILSRYPPTSALPLARGDAENRQALSAAMMRFGDGADSPAILAVHFSRPFPLGSQQRDFALLDEAIDNISPYQLILLGDFNNDTSTFALRQLLNRHGLSPIRSWAPTWPTPSFSLPIPAFIALDHIMIGPGWSVTELRRGPDLGSDHYPLVATLHRKGI